MSIYKNPKFWEGVADRAIRTAAQAGLAAVSVALFTPAGAGAFALILGVAVVGSVLTSLAKPEAVLLGSLPEQADTPEDPEIETHADEADPEVSQEPYAEDISDVEPDYSTN